MKGNNLRRERNKYVRLFKQELSISIKIKLLFWRKIRFILKIGFLLGLIIFGIPYIIFYGLSIGLEYINNLWDLLIDFTWKKTNNIHKPLLDDFCDRYEEEIQNHKEKYET